MENISIVIPTHNRPRLLARAIDSCLAQKTRPFEVIIVDNGIDIPGASVIREFDNQNVPIRYIIGIPNDARAALQLGLESVRGDWVIFLDDDDVLVEDRLATDLAFIRNIEDHVSVFFHDFARFDRSSGTVTIHKLDAKKITRLNAMMLKEFGPQVIGTWRISLLRQLRGYRGRGLLDYDLIGQVLNNSNAVCLSKIGYIQDDTKSSSRLTTTPRRAMIDYIFHYQSFSVACRNDLERKCVKQAVRRAIAFVLGRSGLSYVFNSRYSTYLVKYPLDCLKGRFAYMRRFPSVRFFFEKIRIRGGYIYALSSLKLIAPDLYSQILIWFYEYPLSDENKSYSKHL